MGSPLPGRPHKVLAIVDSDSATTAPLPVLMEQRAQLCKAASRVGAEAVYQVRLLTRQQRGFVSDAYTPFPSVTQGWSDEYFLRGWAVIYEENLPKDMPQYRPAGAK